MAGGQPTKYRHEYCEQLIKHMSEGLSFESFAGTIGTHRDTLYEWCKVHEKFSDAKKQGRDISLLWWEKIGRAAVAGKVAGFSAAAWIFSMKNKHMWVDKTESIIDDRRATLSDLVKENAKEKKKK